METKNEPLIRTDVPEMVITRILNAPRELVFKVWTEPEHIKHWWGPNGFTNTISKMEFRPGGTWEFVMHGPDGTDYPNINEYVEIIRPEKIVLKHSHEPVFTMTVTFEDMGNKTKLTLTNRFESKEVFEAAIEKFGAAEGLKQNVDRMGDYVLEMITKMQPVRQLTMTRICDAPRELVFDAWTNAEHLQKWWAPKGFTNPLCEADARPGGAIRIDMQGPDGEIYPMSGKFIELNRPEKIILTTTAYETTPGVFELENIVTVILEDINGKTKLTVDVKVNKAGEGVAQALSGMNQGWNESLDKLVDFISILQA